MKNEEVEILMVEDNKQDAEMAIRALKKSHLVNNLIHLDDGARAIEFLFGTGEFAGRDTNKKPRLILLDLKMPKMDGIEVLRIIKQHELTKRIPVIVLTSSKESPDIDSCYSLGVNSYIVKPVDFDGFIKAINELGFYWMLLNQNAE
ncbi:MAG: response regulator [Ferruginibacter sp.]